MDIMSKQLDKIVRENCFKLTLLCVDPLISHLSFADDVLIFFDGNGRSLEIILDTLTAFKKGSGLALNLRKSCCLWMVTTWP